MNTKLHIRLYIIAALAFLLGLIKYFVSSSNHHPYFIVVELISFLFFLGTVYLADFILRTSRKQIQEKTDKIIELEKLIKQEKLSHKTTREQFENYINAEKKEKEKSELLIQNMFQNKFLKGSKGEEIGKKILSLLSLHYEIVLGIFYWKDKVEDEFQVKGTFGLNDEMIPLSFVFGEGLNGQVVKDKLPQVIKDLPEDYWEAHSCLGNACPKFIYLLPIIYKNKCAGLIEVASFKKLSLDNHWAAINEKMIEVVPFNSIA